MKQALTRLSEKRTNPLSRTGRRTFPVTRSHPLMPYQWKTAVSATAFDLGFQMFFTH